MVISLLRKLTINYPFLHPREKILRNLPGVPANYGPFIARKGIKYSSYPNGEDYIVKNLFWFGDFEPWVTYIISHLVKPGDTIFDIGANIGDTALQVLPYIGASGLIFCFEPVPILQKCLIKNVKDNKISNVSLVPKALSNFSGTIPFIFKKNQPGGSKMIGDEELNEEIEKIEVEATTMDLWIKDKNIPHIAVCKIDVECHESEVLEGMEGLLNEYRIGSIVFERYMTDDNKDPVVKFLSNYGYKTYRIHKGFLKVKALELNNYFKQLRATSDYVAVLKDSVYEERLSLL